VPLPFCPSLVEEDQELLQDLQSSRASAHLAEYPDRHIVVLEDVPDDVVEAPRLGGSQLVEHRLQRRAPRALLALAHLLLEEGDYGLDTAL